MQELLAHPVSECSVTHCSCLFVSDLPRGLWLGRVQPGLSRRWPHQHSEWWPLQSAPVCASVSSSLTCTHTHTCTSAHVHTRHTHTHTHTHHTHTTHTHTTQTQVFTPEAMLEYLQMFNFLWRAKRMEFTLARLWTNQSADFKLLQSIQGSCDCVDLRSCNTMNLIGCSLSLP